MDASGSIPVTKLSIYPFLPEAALHVKNLNLDIKEISTSPIFGNIIQKSITDITSAIQGELKREHIDDLRESESQLLSYPITRILLSCIDNPHLTQRYAVAESKTASKNLKQETNTQIKTIAEALDLHPKIEKNGFSITFTEYVQTAHTIKELKWKLTNQHINKGWLTLNKDDIIRLLEEKIKKRVLHNMPLSIPEDLCKNLQPHTQEIKTILSKTQKHTYNLETGPLNKEYFPPCITHAIENLQAGINLAHSARFALTSFLLTIGMDTEEVTELFNVSPDFDVEKTRYQIEHIAGSSGTTYTPPSCATMITFGNCIGKNRLCQKISHPIGYYRKKTWLETQKQKTKKQKN
jgi:DNA primase large subunit